MAPNGGGGESNFFLSKERNIFPLKYIIIVQIVVLYEFLSITRRKFDINNSIYCEMAQFINKLNF